MRGCTSSYMYDYGYYKTISNEIVHEITNYHHFENNFVTINKELSLTIVIT